MQKGGDQEYMNIIKKAYGKLILKNHFCLQRGPYMLVSLLDEGAVSNDPLCLKGDFIDLFSPELWYKTAETISPGSQAFLLDLKKVEHKKAQVLASASRIYDEKENEQGYSFCCKSPKNTTNIMCLYLPKNFKEPEFELTDKDGNNVSYTLRHIVDGPGKYNKRLYWLKFENDPDGVSLQIRK